MTTSTPEAGGYTVSGGCGWTAWKRNHNDADKARREHEKKCKGCGGGGS